LNVGGLFDAENLYGPQKIYQTLETVSPTSFNIIVLGPWKHGGWARSDGTSLGEGSFSKNSSPSDYYQREIELPFFYNILKRDTLPLLNEAYIFETGTNRWRHFDQWPPNEVQYKQLFLQEDDMLCFTPPESAATSFDEFISDPNNPVPYSETPAMGMDANYMIANQQFVSARPDVISYQSDELDGELTIAGNSVVELWVSTTATDADWIVKLIDVYPENPSMDNQSDATKMSGYQQLVRSEVFRGRYRNSYSLPEPFTPNKPTLIRFELLDMLHTYRRGHRIMIQIQSTWFPLVDRNPQKYIPNIYTQTDYADFVKATHRVYHQNGMFSNIRVGILE